MKLPAYNFIPQVFELCLNEWQGIWNIRAAKSIFAIYTAVGSVWCSKILSRREAVIINRLWLGLSQLIHSYLLLGNDRPIYEACKLPLTVKHILLEYPELQDIWHEFFTVLWKSCLKMPTIKMSSILSKKSRFYEQVWRFYRLFIAAIMPRFYILILFFCCLMCLFVHM